MPVAVPYPDAPPRDPDELPAEGPGSIPTIWLRVAARLFDSVLVFVPLVVLSLPYVRLTSSDPVLDQPDWLRVTTAAVPLLYEVVFLMWRGATPGKMLCGIAVCSYVGGGRCGAYQAGLRVFVPGMADVLSLAVAAGGVRSALGLVAPIMYAASVYHPLRRGLHDRAAGTIVLRVR